MVFTTDTVNIGPFSSARVATCSSMPNQFVEIEYCGRTITTRRYSYFRWRNFTSWEAAYKIRKCQNWVKYDPLMEN